MANNDFFTLEIGERSIKFFDGFWEGQLINVKNLSYIDLPFPFFAEERSGNLENTAKLIKNTLNGLKINKKKVNIIIPDAYTYTQILEMPNLNEKELISAIKYQADQFIPLPIDEINLDLEVLSKNENENSLLVLVVAASKKLITRIEELVQLCTLIPNQLENQISSFGRFLEKSSSYFFKNIEDSPIAFINLDLTNSSIYLFDKNTSLITKVHNFNLGFNLFVKEIKINTSLENDKIYNLLSSFNFNIKTNFNLELIISPIIKQFIFEFKKIIPSNTLIFLMGESFRFPALADILSKEPTLQIKNFNPYPILKSSPQVEHYKNNLSFFVTTFGGQIEWKKELIF